MKPDFECPYMMLDDRHPDTAGCFLQVFGPFPSLATCIRQCKGDPAAYRQRKIDEAKQAKNKVYPCIDLDSDMKTCNNPICESDLCIRIDGQSCKHYKRNTECKTCGGK